MNVHRAAGRASSLIVAAAVIAGLVVSGSPLEQRLLRLDERRVSDLQTLSRALERYRERNGSLPASLPSLLDGRALSRLPSEPDGRAYEYAVHESGRYTLCARFERASEGRGGADFWEHPSGRHCFSLNAGLVRP